MFSGTSFSLVKILRSTLLLATSITLLSPKLNGGFDEEGTLALAIDFVERNALFYSVQMRSHSFLHS